MMPNRLNPVFKTIKIFAIALFFGLIILQNFSPARAVNTQLEYRIRRLETDISRLRGEINRLKSQTFSSNLSDCPRCVEEQTDGKSRMLSGDPMFDRLAVMTIELKEDVIEIQERLLELEQKIPDS